jgi:hypothetical protein
MSGTMKKILIQETGNSARSGEIVRVSIPCARGDFKADQLLSVCNQDRQVQLCQSRVLKQWPDGSIKWLLIDFAASVSAGGTAEFFLTSADNVPTRVSPVNLKQGDGSWQVDTGNATFVIDTHVFRPFTAVRVAGKEILRPTTTACLLSLDGKTDMEAVVDSITLEESGPLRAVARLTGHFNNLAEKAHFSCRLHFLSGSSAVNIEFTIHNPCAALHPGGLWDLGDLGSLLFKSLTFSFSSIDLGDKIQSLPASGTSPITVPGNAQFSLYQESSGGENWRSPTHRNRDGIVPTERNGYGVEVDGQKISAGMRATPVVWCGSGAEGIAVTVPFFWQEFPSEITVDNGNLRVIPFPARFPDQHELQGGEQKTSAFWVDFAAERGGLSWTLKPLVAYAAPEVYRESGVLYDLPGAIDLVDRFTTSKDLFGKRETADEYGWRNFGEIYADHEAVYHDKPEIFVSHYNNQYDGIAGLYRKFFATGDIEWRTLAEDLSRHVTDIDLYHTDNDREEYNHGLFWHTDHYVDAGLSSHRSFSKQHLVVKPPHLCGGGPGAEHCYTTGLMLHYFQTGNPDFKTAVLALAESELLALAGPQTLLAALKRGMGALNRWRFSRGQGKLFPRYPFTRGTGNALTACLDAFEIGGGHSYLDTAEQMIRGTVHPADNIAARNLLDAEVAWSYTVFLSALAKYLDKKRELVESDPGSKYARACLLVYAEWMVTNEYPYLDKPEILEYPNETWAAQDLRKSVIFYHAARYAETAEQRQRFRERARYFYEYAEKELSRHASSSLTRPVVLMLQNGWVGSRLNDDLQELSGPLAPLSCSPTPYLTIGEVIRRVAADLFQVLGQTSFKRELSWLRARLG